MKAIYYLVTFLASLVVLTWGGLKVYENWDIIKTIPTKLKSCNCKGSTCTCNGNCNCTDDKKCSLNCDCPK